MRLNHVQERIVNMLGQGMVSPKEMAKKLGKGYDELKVQSMVLTLAHKGAINGLIAGIILHGTEMEKFLPYGHGSELKKPFPEIIRR